MFVIHVTRPKNIAVEVMCTTIFWILKFHKFVSKHSLAMKHLELAT